MSDGFIRRNVPLPPFAPSVSPRKGSHKAAIVSLKEGESGVVNQSQSSARQTCERLVTGWCGLYGRYAKLGMPEKAGPEPRFAVWKADSDGSANETGKTFALVARLTDSQANAFRAENPAAVIEPRTVEPSMMQGIDAELARQSREEAA